MLHLGNDTGGHGISTPIENISAASKLHEEQFIGSASSIQTPTYGDDTPTKLMLFTNTKELFAHLEEKCWLAVLLMRALIYASDGSNDGCLNEDIILCPVLYRYLEERTSSNFSPPEILKAFLPSMTSDQMNSVIESHLQNQNWNECLKYLNSWKCRNSALQEAIKPFLNLVLSKLAQSIEYTDEVCSPWMYIMQIKDGKYKAEFVIENYRKWPAEGAKMALRDAITCLSTNDSNREELTRCLETVQLYEKVRR